MKSFKDQFYTPETGYLVVFVMLIWCCVFGPLIGCEIPISTWDVKSKVAEIEGGGLGECEFDGFDAICLIPQPYEVIIEVEKVVEVKKIVEVEVMVPGETIYIQVPGETQIVEVVTEVEVPVEVIREVTKIITERVEVPVEVIKIVEVPGETVVLEVPVEKVVEVEKVVYVDREVIKEIEKIIEKPVEVIKIVEKPVPVEVIKEVEKIVEIPVPTRVDVPFTGKIPISESYLGYNDCAGSCHAVIKNGVYQWMEYIDEDGTVYTDDAW